MRKKVILAIAHKAYQQIEYGVTKDVLSKAGFDIITASDKEGIATAQDGSTTKIDLTINQINPAAIQGLFIIGGPGALECLDNQELYSILQTLMVQAKPYGAICISPRILAHAEVLGGKKATGWDGDNKLAEIFQKHVVTYQPNRVVTDGLVVTANGPEASEEFGMAIIEVFKLIH